MTSNQSIEWNPSSPEGWIEEIEATFHWVHEVYTGKCPRCRHQMSKDFGEVRIPLNLMTEGEIMDVYVACNCSFLHSCRPDAVDSGCGADGVLRVRA